MEEYDQSSKVLSQWDLLLENVSELKSGAASLKMQVGKDMDALEVQVQMANSKIGHDPGMVGENPFVSVWNGIALVNDGMQEAHWVMADKPSVVTHQQS